MSVAETVPGVAMASAIDTGDVNSPFTPVHTRKKQTPGARLAAAALATLFGFPDVQYRGPTYMSATARFGATSPDDAPPPLVVTVSFDPATLYGAPPPLVAEHVCGMYGRRAIRPVCYV